MLKKKALENYNHIKSQQEDFKHTSYKTPIIDMRNVDVGYTIN